MHSCVAAMSPSRLLWMLLGGRQKPPNQGPASTLGHLQPFLHPAGQVPLLPPHCLRSGPNSWAVYTWPFVIWLLPSLLALPFTTHANPEGLPILLPDWTTLNWPGLLLVYMLLLLLGQD